MAKRGSREKVGKGESPPSYWDLAQQMLPTLPPSQEYRGQLPFLAYLFDRVLEFWGVKVIEADIETGTARKED